MINTFSDTWSSFLKRSKANENLRCSKIMAIGENIYLDKVVYMEYHFIQIVHNYQTHQMIVQFQLINEGELKKTKSIKRK